VTLLRAPLQGLRIVEIAGGIAGPYCAKLLADLGGRVTKIEPPAGDPLRQWGPFPGDVPDPDRSGLFAYLNAGKQLTTLDFTQPSDVETAREWIAQAHVLVEDHAPGMLDRMGFADLRECNPELVAVRISNFGQTGPARDVEATPLVMQAASGWITRRDLDRAPVQAGARIPEHIVGAYGALGALTALRVGSAARDRLIEVDVSALESLLSTLPYPMLIYDRMQRLGLPTNLNAGPMLGIVRAADGWVGINCLTGQHWLDVCAMVGLPEFREHQIAVMMGAPEREKFFASVNPWLAERTVDEIVELAQAMRIPAAPVGDGATVPELPQYRARGFFADERGEGWSFRRPGPPYRLSRTPAASPSVSRTREAGSASDTSERRAAGARQSEPALDPSLPFAGLKVFDLSTFWAGAYVTCYLGAFGADILKVESIQRPDGHRYSGNFPREGADWFERGPLWQGTNLNKRDITLNLASARGRELAHRLAADADVVIENFSPRVVEEFGLDYASLAKRNPAVIAMRMPGFGLEGPWRDYVGWALNIEQITGMAAITGYPDGPPCSLGGAADPIVGVHAAVALIAALEHRRRTGEGQLIEVAQIEVGACIAAEPVIGYSMNGVVPARAGNRQRGYAQGVYPTSGDRGWVAISVRDDADWLRLVDAMGRPDLLSDRRFASASARETAHDAFDALVTDWTCTRDAEEIVENLRARGVPVARLLTPDRMYGEPQLEARGFYQELEHPLTGVRRYPGWPFRITPGPTRHHRLAPPTLGQHNDEILRGLGLSDDELAALRREQVIGERLIDA
jgi:crotonobetainyl-CoA:carnitine CoA-transferase CaiB-like acyl-CoA transferase